MYREALKISPRNPEAHTHLALTLIHMQQMDEALKHLHTAVELDPKNADLHYVHVAGAFLDTQDLQWRGTDVSQGRRSVRSPTPTRTCGWRQR